MVQFSCCFDLSVHLSTNVCENVTTHLPIRPNTADAVKPVFNLGLKSVDIKRNHNDKLRNSKSQLEKVRCVFGDFHCDIVYTILQT